MRMMWGAGTGTGVYTPPGHPPGFEKLPEIAVASAASWEHSPMLACGAGQILVGIRTTGILGGKPTGSSGGEELAE